MAKKWMQNAVKNPGGLHRAMGIPMGQKIPWDAMVAAAKKKGKIGRMARLAMTMMKSNK